MNLRKIIAAVWLSIVLVVMLFALVMAIIMAWGIIKILLLAVAYTALTIAVGLSCGLAIQTLIDK